MSDANDTTIQTNLGNPSEMSQGDKAVKQHNLKDQIETAKYLKQQAFSEASQNKGGLGIFNLVPPGHS